MFGKASNRILSGMQWSIMSYWGNLRTFRRNYVAVSCLVLGVLGAQTTLADVQGETVTITNVGGSLIADKPAPSLIIKTGASDVIEFTNSTGAQITIDNTTFPAGQKKTAVGGDGVADGITKVYTFNCDADSEGFVFTITQAGANPVTVTVTVTCTVPTVSEWGLVVMMLLVLAAGTIILRRRRAMLA